MMAHSSSNDDSYEQMSRIIAAMVIEKDKKEGASIINNECVNGKTESLDCVLDIILNPEEKIDNSDNIEWCKWLIAGGRTPDEFSSIGKVNDIIIQAILYNARFAISSISFSLFLCVNDILLLLCV